MVDFKHLVFRVLLIFSFFLAQACFEDVDFDQPTDVILNPVFDVSVAFFEIEASQFVETGMEAPFVNDSITDIDIFQDDFIRDNLVKAELTFSANNTINRSFILRFDFFDNENQLQHTFSFTIPASSTGTPVVIEHIETFESTTLDALLNTTQLELTAILVPSTDGSILNENSTGRVEVQSKGRFYFNVESGV